MHKNYIDIYAVILSYQRLQMIEFQYLYYFKEPDLFSKPHKMTKIVFSLIGMGYMGQLGHWPCFKLEPEVEGGVDIR